MNTVPTAPQPGESHPHYELITGLLELAGFLSDVPALPVGRQMLFIVLDLPMRASDSDQIAFVRQVARYLDVDPYWFGSSGTHFYATRTFGEHITLEARAIMKAAIEESDRVQQLGMKALKAEKAAAAGPVEPMVAVDDQAPVVEQLAAAAAPVDDGRADGNAACGARAPQRAALEIHAAAAVAGEGIQLCGECEGSGSGFAGECTSCWGTGRMLAEPPRCPACNGQMIMTDVFGLPTGEPCGTCHGTGYQQPAVSAW